MKEQKVNVIKYDNKIRCTRWPRRTVNSVGCLGLELLKSTSKGQASQDMGEWVMNRCEE